MNLDYGCAVLYTVVAPKPAAGRKSEHLLGVTLPASPVPRDAS
jgi:hypothetical protein